MCFIETRGSREELDSCFVVFLGAVGSFEECADGRFDESMGWGEVLDKWRARGVGWMGRKWLRTKIQIIIRCKEP